MTTVTVTATIHYNDGTNLQQRNIEHTPLFYAAEVARHSADVCRIELVSTDGNRLEWEREA